MLVYLVLQGNSFWYYLHTQCTIQQSVFLLWFPPNLSCLQNNPPENNVEQFPPNLSCLQNNTQENNVEDLARTRSTLFSGGLFWDRFLLDLRNFFGAHFRYKLMYYYFSSGVLCGASSLQISKTIRRKIMWSQFPPNLTCLQINLLENNVEPVPSKFELPPKQSAGK